MLLLEDLNAKLAEKSYSVRDVVGTFGEATCISSGSLWIELFPNENGMSEIIRRSCVIHGELKRVSNPLSYKSVVDCSRTDSSLLGVTCYRLTAILDQ